ncbi:MAG: rhodanese-like domain-containing protein [Pseudolabrys sp.]
MARNIRIALAAVSALLFSTIAVPASAAPLVSPSWLRQHLHDANLVVLDVYDGNQRAIFTSGHIPGALFTDFEHDGWRTTVNGTPHVLPPIKQIEKVIGGFGIDNNSQVVVVPGGRQRADFNAATRVYWTFKVLGHDKVSILNGGDKAWFANESDPVARGATKAKPKTFVAYFRRNLLATRESVEKALKTHNVLLIDTGAGISSIGWKPVFPSRTLPYRNASWRNAGSI